jgi:hypothetical protein
MPAQQSSPRDFKQSLEVGTARSAIDASPIMAFERSVCKCGAFRRARTRAFIVISQGVDLPQFLKWGRDQSMGQVSGRLGCPLKSATGFRHRKIFGEMENLGSWRVWLQHSASGKRRASKDKSSELFIRCSTSSACCGASEKQIIPNSIRTSMSLTNCLG